MASATGKASHAHLPPSPADEWRAGPSSQLFFSWIFPLLRLGAKQPLQRADCGHAPVQDHCTPHALRFEAAFRTRLSTRAALYDVFWSRMTKGALCKGIGDGAQYAQIWAVKCILLYAESRENGVHSWPSDRLSLDTSLRVVDCAILVLVLAPFVSGLALHWFYHHVRATPLHLSASSPARRPPSRREPCVRSLGR